MLRPAGAAAIQPARQMRGGVLAARESSHDALLALLVLALCVPVLALLWHVQVLATPLARPEHGSVPVRAHAPTTGPRPIAAQQPDARRTAAAALAPRMPQHVQDRADAPARPGWLEQAGAMDVAEVYRHWLAWAATQGQGEHAPRELVAHLRSLEPQEYGEGLAIAVRSGRWDVALAAYALGAHDDEESGRPSVGRVMLDCAGEEGPARDACAFMALQRLQSLDGFDGILQRLARDRAVCGVPVRREQLEMAAREDLGSAWCQ